MKRRLALIATVLALAATPRIWAQDTTSATPNVLRVGPAQKFLSIREAAQAAHVGDTVEIEAGDYAEDVAVWEKDLVKIVGVGGRPRILAGPASAEGKGTFVVRARGVEVTNLEFVGARAPDHYGSGIRIERGSIRIANSKFTDNEFAILTANDAAIVVEVEGCEFSGLVDQSDRGNALSHTLYAGAIDTLRVEGSYFHNGSVGHLVKSRARNNLIRYNRITDENGISSYELEFPDGGNAVVVGNLIQQGRRSENGVIVSYGAENLRWKENKLEAVFNTVVNDRAFGGVFFDVRGPAESMRIRYNVLVGGGEMRVPAGARVGDNVRASSQDFVDPGRFDFRPRVSTKWVGIATGAEHVLPAELLPTKEYRHRASTQPLRRAGRLMPLTPGDLQTVGH